MSDLILNASEDLDKKLMSQIMTETMLSFDYVPKHDYSDDFSISRIQEQFQHFCMQAKSNLVIDIIQPGQETMIAVVSNLVLISGEE